MSRKPTPPNSDVTTEQVQGEVPLRDLVMDDVRQLWTGARVHVKRIASRLPKPWKRGMKAFRMAVDFGLEPDEE